MYIYEKYYVKMTWSEIRKTLSLAFYLNNIFTGNKRKTIDFIELNSNIAIVV